MCGDDPAEHTPDPDPAARIHFCEGCRQSRRDVRWHKKTDRALCPNCTWLRSLPPAVRARFGG